MLSTEGTHELPHYCVTLAGTASELRNEGGFWGGLCNGLVCAGPNRVIYTVSCCYMMFDTFINTLICQR